MKKGGWGEGGGAITFTDHPASERILQPSYYRLLPLPFAAFQRNNLQDTRREGFSPRDFSLLQRRWGELVACDPSDTASEMRV